MPSCDLSVDFLQKLTYKNETPTLQDCRVTTPGTQQHRSFHVEGEKSPRGEINTEQIFWGKQPLSFDQGKADSGLTARLGVPSGEPRSQPGPGAQHDFRATALRFPPSLRTLCSKWQRSS